MISIQPGSSLTQSFFLMRQPKAFLIMSVLCMSKQQLDNQLSQHNSCGSAQYLFMFSYEYNIFKPTKLQDSML